MITTILNRLKLAGIETKEGQVRLLNTHPVTGAPVTDIPIPTSPVYKSPVLVFLSQIGEAEVAGNDDNSTIMQYAKDCDMPEYTHDEIAWCSLLMNWIMLVCGFTRTKTLAARDWLKIGIKITDPQMGDVVIFWRDKPDGWEGHVALFIRKENGVVWCGGGNQSNMISIIPMPEARVLGYRRMERI